MYFFKTPKILKFLLNGCLWQVTTDKKEIYLTFDDGPIPEVTPWILELLKKYDAKSTFFCVGSNVRLYPRIYQNILENGHTTGNHTYNHCNGWLTSRGDYTQNVDKAAEWVESNLFRPPYGKLTPGQYLEIKKKYTIVMWDVLSGDFDPELTPEKCIQELKKNTKPGSIVVFHDNVKSFRLLKEVLPDMLDYWRREGFEFKSLYQIQPLQK